MSDYQFISIIGHGTFGVVYKAVHIQSGLQCAIKKFYKKYKTLDECMNLGEVKFLNQFSHKSLIKLIDIYLDKHELHLVFEHMEQNLYQYYSQFKRQNRLMPENLIARIIQQLLEGVQYMHDVGYFHRDLKPENILISKEIIKVCDLGSVKPIDCAPPFTEYTSTRWYRSPEQIIDKGYYNHPVDIFAVGTIMAELYTFKPLFQGKSSQDQFHQICNVLGQPYLDNKNLQNAHKPIPFENIMPFACPEAIDFLQQIIQMNPEKRPSAKDLLQHEFFKKFNKFDHMQNKTSFRITTINQKQNQQSIDDFTEEQKKILSLSLEPKHKQLSLLKKYKETQKKSIFQLDFPHNQFQIQSQLINNDQIKYKGRILHINKKKPPQDQCLVFPKILIQKKNGYQD